MDKNNLTSASEADIQGPQLTGLKNDVDAKPPTIRYMSSPAHQSPLRHHYKRASNPRRQVKETSNARSEYSNSEEDGIGEHRINQYLLGQEIGRGSFGSVHLAVDQFGREFAVKEFSKSRLRKRQQSNLLRKSRAANATKKGLHHQIGYQIQQTMRAKLHLPPHGPIQAPSNSSPFELIKEEIAIMKKLDHPNVVSLIEVLDDPSEDSLYMVLEMCKKGVVMKVGLNERAEPYAMNQCRHWFRDMVMGLEYLHAQGIVHRDIKPDNCLITADDCLKIVDFGVSEMFSKDQPDMTTAKHAGSPAFMPPELCVVKHGEVSGKAADIWSMGVTLYCLCFGHIPFEKTGMIELFESIRTEPVPIPEDCDVDLADLLRGLLEKDPAQRMTMDQIREHPWVTLKGEDPLLPKEDNINNIIEPPTEDEVNAAITAPMRRMITVMKAAHKFKSLLAQNATSILDGMMEGRPMVAPPGTIQYRVASGRAQSDLGTKANNLEGTLAAEGIHREFYINDDLQKTYYQAEDANGSQEKVRIANHAPWSSRSRSEARSDSTSSHGAQRPGPIPTSPDAHPQVSDKPPDASDPSIISLDRFTSPTSGKGQAHDPLEDTLFLSIGASSHDAPLEEGDVPIVSESPSAVEIGIYERAYEEEVQRIIAARAAEPEPRRPTLYLTKRVEGVQRLRNNQAITDFSRSAKSTLDSAAAVAYDNAAWGIGKLQEAVKSGLETTQRQMSRQSTQDKIERARQLVAEFGYERPTQLLEAVRAQQEKQAQAQAQAEKH